MFRLSAFAAFALLLSCLSSLTTAAPAPPAIGKRWTLDSLCTTSYVASLVSELSDLSTVTYHPSSVNATIFTNHSATPNAGGPFWPLVTGLDFCNVTLSFTHKNLNDNVTLTLQFPDPAVYKNRWLTLGGGGWSVSGTGNLDAGLAYGAASGATDGGFGYGGQLTAQLISKVNGTIDWSRIESFGYQAIHELTVTGKELAKSFYNATSITSYYMGCSEGGREGHQSTQKYPKDFNGVVAAAPAFYFPVVQLAQAWPNMAMAQANHWPSPCAFQAVFEDVIAECDPLDGKSDGIVSRSELCSYDTSNSVGKTWSNCNLTSVTSVGAPTSGTISQADADVVKAIYRGPFTSSDEQIYWTYRNGTNLNVEAVVAYQNGSWVSGQNFFFGTYYQNLVLKNTVAPTVNYSTLSVDGIYELMKEGLQQYGSFTEATFPDLSDFQAAGGKLIHWHGEQDTNLYPQGSANFFERVQSIMYPGSTDYGPINDFYRFFLVPGAAHCAINSYQPDGPFPQYALQQLIDWVEQGTAPAYLNGTTQSGSSTQPEICLWPTRPSWDSSGKFSCVQANAAAEFIQPLNAWKVHDY